MKLIRALCLPAWFWKIPCRNFMHYFFPIQVILVLAFIILSINVINFFLPIYY